MRLPELWIMMGTILSQQMRAEEIRWGIMSTFPRPMPVMHDSQVFPRFFTTNESLGMPFLPMDSNTAVANTYETWNVNGSLCFTISNNETEPCIHLGNYSYAKLGKIIRNKTTKKYQVRYEANATILYGWWPTKRSTDDERSNRKVQPQYAPFCTSRKADSATLLPWTGCQSRRANNLQGTFFTFSPMEGYGNFTEMDPFSYDIDPFDVWLLCGSGGSCSDITPMATILGGGTNQALVVYNPNADEEVSATIREKTTKLIEATPVCVWPPFVWVVCTADNCSYTLCWNASVHQTATVARMPRFVPMPVRTTSTLTLFREKRDFGITAAIVSIIATAAVAASLTASALALSGQVETANTLNNLSASVSQAIDVQASINTQIRGGLMIVNQRIDLVQEQIDILWQMAQLGCEVKLPGLCVTSIQYENLTQAANLSKELSQQLQTNWSADFEATMRRLRMAIIQINSTRLDLSLTQGLSTWISSIFSYFKEWVGVGLFGCIVLVGVSLTLWMLCKFKRQYQREKIVLAQALFAVEQGASPQVWLSML